MWEIALAYVGASIYNAYAEGEQAEAEAGVAREKARLKAMEADEVLRRSRANIEDFMLEGRAAIEAQRVATAGSGLGAGGTSLTILEDSFGKLIENVNRQREEAEWKAKMLRAGADIDTRLAGDIERGGRMGQIGTLLSGGAKAYGAYHMTDN